MSNSLADNLASSDNFDDELAGLGVNELIDLGVKTRDELKEKTRLFKEYKNGADNLLLRICHHLKAKGDELGVDSFKTADGTAFRNTKESYRVLDWQQTLAFMQATGNWQMLEKRVAKLATKEIHQTTGAIPPGLDYIVEETFVIRRPNERRSNDD